MTIEELKELLSNHGINYINILKTDIKKLIKVNDYNLLNEKLNYLLNELEISKLDIENNIYLLYSSIETIKNNVEFLKSKDIMVKDLGLNLNILVKDNLIEDYNYLSKGYGVKTIKNKIVILSIDLEYIKKIEELDFPFFSKNEIIKIAIEKVSIKKLSQIKNSKYFNDYSYLFTAETIIHCNLKDVEEIIESPYFRTYQEIFTPQLLANASLDKIKQMLESEELSLHKEFITPSFIAFGNLEELKKVINSKEYKLYPHLFTPQSLAKHTYDEIVSFISSDVFYKHQDLFTATVLILSDIDSIRELLESEEYRLYPDLFTSVTLSFANINDIKQMIHSEEFNLYPELFTSTTISTTTIDNIKEIVNSKEFKTHPELFTSTVVSLATLSEIRELLKLPYWDDKRYKHLLTPSILAKSRLMVSKIPIIISIAENYNIDEYLSINCLLKSPSQLYALINYMLDKHMPLIVDNKINSIFNLQPGALKNKYDIDLKKIMIKYPFNEIGFMKGKKYV